MKFRLKLFFGHLVVSLIVAMLVLALIFGVWYPSPFDKALGVGSVLIILLAIDVILGPLMTLILAKEGKKGLKFDLIVIGIVQLSALCYGLYNINKGRPVAVAFDVSRFEIVQNHMVQDKRHREILQQYSQEQGQKIPIIAIRPPKDDDEFLQRMNNEMELGKFTVADYGLYQPLEKDFHVIQAHIKPLAKFSTPNNKAKNEQIFAQYPQADGFVSIFTNHQSLTALIDSKNKKVVAVLNLEP